jgi:acetylornithine deacetylase/succinyl-diaminopimelate desuccinylase-like protein
LVPNQKPEKIAKLIKDFVRKKNRDVRVIVDAGGPALKGITSGPYADAVKRSMKIAFGKQPVFVREGGSIGAVVTMQKLLKCPVLFLGLSLPEHGYHAPNENFDWQQASGGIAAFAEYFEQISRM